MRKWLVLGLVMGVVAGACARPAQFVVGESVAGDFRGVAEELWGEFEVFAENRLDCFGSLTLQASTTLEDRAQYEPPTKTLTVLVPRSVDSLRESLVHEFAHHVERDCADHEEMRPAFLAAMGASSDTDWYVSDRWATTPSERFAEATVEVFLGSRERPADVQLSQEELDVVAHWWSASGG